MASASSSTSSSPSVEPPPQTAGLLSPTVALLTPQLHRAERLRSTSSLPPPQTEDGLLSPKLARAAPLQTTPPPVPPSTPAPNHHHHHHHHHRPARSRSRTPTPSPNPPSLFDQIIGKPASPISLSELLGPIKKPPKMAVDCRTRTHAYGRQYGRKSSGGTTGSSNYAADGSAARIFDHRRDPHDLENRRTTDVQTPTSFKEVLAWFDGIMDEARHTPPPPSPIPGKIADGKSRVALLFLDEKRCAKILNEEFPMARIEDRLRIYDWNPAHYMSAFCLFPTPLDITDDDETMTSRIWEWRYCISHPFDWDMLWAYLPTTRTSIGIVRTWFDGYDDNFVDLENAVINFPGPSLANPMLLGLLSLQILTADTMVNVREKGNRLFEAQKMTGFHNYRRLRETDGDEVETIGSDLGLITKEILGASSNLTGWVNAATQLGRFAKFVASESQRFETHRFETQSFETERGSGGTGSSNLTTKTTTRYQMTTTTKLDGTSRRLSRYLVHQSEKLGGDLDGAYHDTQAWLQTAQFLLQGVLNLVSQHDANVNIALAKDSKKIAQESKRDSTSMTAIAVVTMFFLPGTFTASFFGMPYFSDFAILSWFYWAITVPLTVLVLCMWFVYTKWINPPVSKLERQREREAKGGSTRSGGLRIKSWKILSRRNSPFREKTAEA